MPNVTGNSILISGYISFLPNPTNGFGLLFCSSRPNLMALKTDRDRTSIELPPSTSMRWTFMFAIVKSLPRHHYEADAAASSFQKLICKSLVGSEHTS